MEEIKQQALTIYSGFLLAIIFNFIPVTFVQTFGAFIFLGLIIAAYIMRSQAEKESFMYSHMSYLIKTFWISSLILLIGIIESYIFADHSIIYTTVNGVKNGSMLSETEINALLIEYIQANRLVFALTLGPSLLYLIYRTIKGIMLASKNTSIPNPKNWL